MSNIDNEYSQGRRWSNRRTHQGKSISVEASSSPQEKFAVDPHAYVVSELIAYAVNNRDSMIRRLMNSGHSMEDAEDAFQQGITNVLGKQEIKQANGIKKFITTTIVRAGIDMRRSNWKHLYTDSVFDLMDVRGQQEPIDEEIITHTEVERVFENIKDIKDKDQRILLLKLYAMGYSDVELGNILGLSPVTVRTRISRTNAKIRESLK